MPSLSEDPQCDGVLSQEGDQDHHRDHKERGVEDDVLQNDTKDLLLDAEVGGHHI